MMHSVSFTVSGLPMHSPRASDKDRESDVRAWRKAVSHAALVHHITWIRRSPLCVRLVFHLPVPKHPPRSEWAPTGARLTRLADELIEGLVMGRVLIDPSQVVDLRVRKCYGDPGVDINVTEIQTSSGVAA